MVGRSKGAAARRRGIRNVAIFGTSLIVAAVAVAAVSSSASLHHSEVSRAMGLMARGHTAEGEQILRNLLAEDPDDVRARRELARVCLRTDRPLEAVEHYSHILRRQARDYDATMGLGRAYQAADLPDMAVLYFEEAARIAPEDPEPLKQAALLHLGAGNRPMAMYYLQQAQALAPDDMTLVDLLRDATKAQLTSEIDRETSGGLGLRRGPMNALPAISPPDPFRQIPNRARESNAAAGRPIRR